MTDYRKLDVLVLDVIKIVKEVNQIIKKVYESGEYIDVSLKEDNSPVTKADKLADKYIRDELSIIEPNIPIISEEYRVPTFDERKNWRCLWLVDPLDGTKEFIERTGEFTVNIALIENNEPILGVVGAPITGEIFAWYKGAKSSFYIGGTGIDNKKIFMQGGLTKTSRKIKVLVSRRHTNNKNLHLCLEKFGFSYEIGECGSSLKMCRIANGEGDIYIRLGPTSEWDTAAGHAILRGVGGGIYENTTLFDKEIRYNDKENITNPEFVAVKNMVWFKDLINS